MTGHAVTGVKYLRSAPGAGVDWREPIVCTQEDAFCCFMGSEIETLVSGNCVLQKDRQNPALKLDYKNAFELE